MSMIEPVSMGEYERQEFFRNNALVSAVKDIKETLEKHGITVYARYSEHYDEEEMKEEQFLTPEFSGCDTTFDLDKLRQYLEAV